MILEPQKTCHERNFPERLIFKDGFVGDITFIRKEERFPKSPLALL
jgi:hypothetical protein